MKRGRSLLLYLGLWLMIFSGAAFLFSRYFQRNMETGEMTADPSSAYKVIELFPGRPKFLVENSLEDGGRYCVDLSELAAGDGTYRTAYMEPDGRGRVWLHMEVWQKEEMVRSELWVCNPRENERRKAFTYEYKDGAYSHIDFFTARGGIVMAGLAPADMEENPDEEQRVARLLIQDAPDEAPVPLPELKLFMDTSVDYYVTRDQGLWYMDRYGSVWRCAEDKTVRPVFRNDGSRLSTRSVYPAMDGESVYFYNLDAAAFFRVMPDGELREFSRPDLETFMLEGRLLEIVSWDRQDRITARINGEEDRPVMAVFVPGEEMRVISGCRMPDSIRWKLALLNGLLSAFAATALLGGLLGAVYLCKRLRVIPVTLQIAAAAVPILLTGGLYVRTQVQRMFYNRQLEAEKVSLMHAACLEAGRTDSARFATDPVDVNYLEERIVQISSVQWAGTDALTAEEMQEYRDKLSVAFYWLRGDESYVIDLDVLVTMPAFLQLFAPEMELLTDCLENGQVVIGSWSYAGEDYIQAFAPVLEKDGMLAGAVSYRLGVSVLSRYAGRVAGELMQYMMRRLLLLLTAVMLLTYLSLKPLGQLKEFLKAVEENETPKRLPVRGHNEVSALISIFNRMSEHIREYLERVRRLKERYEPFVPEDLIALLGKEDIRFAEPGDQAECTASLALIDMASFAEEQEKNGAEKMLEQINRGLQTMIPAAREEGGQIICFYQGGLLLLFPGQGERAAACVLRILKDLRDSAAVPYYAAMDYRTIRIELLGNEARMDFAIRREDWEDIKDMQALSASASMGVIAGQGLIDQLKAEGASCRLRCL